MANRFRLEQIQEFYITPTTLQHGMVPKWNNTTKRFDWVYSLLQLGEGHDDAYFGDLGKIAYDHAVSPHNYEPLITKTAGYAKIVGGNWTFVNSTFVDVAPGANENVLISNGTIWTSSAIPDRHVAVTLATNHGLSLTAQTLALGTPSSITSASTNSVSTTTHTHAITAGLGFIGNGTQANEILVTGTTPFSPTWTLATNLVSLNALAFASTSFVKMTSAGVFGLDTTTYLSSVTAHDLLSATHGNTTAASVVRGDIITGQGATPKWVRLAFPVTSTGKLLQATATDIEWSTNPLTIGTSASIAGPNTGDVTLATDHGLSLSNQVIAMGTPSTLTPTTTNAVSTTTHTHAVTVGLGWIGNGSEANQIPLTGTTPFIPVWTTVTNLVSLNNLSYVAGSFVKMTATNTFALDTNVYVIKSGDTGLGNMAFNNNATIDNVGGGTDVLNIGTAYADTINIGWSGSTINIQGTLVYQNVDNLEVKDKLIRLNKGGAIESGVSSGFEIEEGGVVTGWFTSSGARTGFELRAPATSYSAIFLLSSLLAERTYTFPDASGTVALTSNLHNAVTLAANSGLELSTQVLNMGTPSNITSATTNSVTTSTHTHAITASLGFIGNGTQANEILVTGATPFAPAWTLATNLVSLNALTYAAVSFVKMTAVGTFALDTNTYIVSGTVPTTITVANEATDITCYPLFVTDVTGNLAPKTNSTLTFNSSTGAFTANKLISTTDATINGLTVGRGLGSVVSNVAVGYNALYSDTTGHGNSAIGNSALYSNTEGVHNSAIGDEALYFNTLGNDNSAVGANALYFNATGSDNSAVGYSALFYNTIGYYNAAIGYLALYSNTTGFSNSAIGHNAGRYISGGATANQTSNTSLYLGAVTKALANGDVNEIVLGYDTTGFGSNTVAYGNTSITKHIFQSGNIGAGVTDPLAKVHIAAGTATASTAPFKLTQSGAVVLTTPEAGAIECNDGDVLYYTIKTGPTRKTIAFTDSAITSSMYIGTTSVALNRASAALTLAGITLTTPDIGTPSAGVMTNVTGTATSLTSGKATNLVGGNSTTLLGSVPYQSNTDVTTLLSPNTTTTRKFLTQTGTGTNGAVPVWEAILASEVGPLLNDEWLRVYDYAGNVANLAKLSKDNITEFAFPVGINSFYHVLNSGFNDIVDIPVNAVSPDNTQHGVGITIGNSRIFSVSALSTGAGGIDTPTINTTAVINSTNINPLLTLAESWIGPSSTSGVYFKGGNVGIGTTTIPSMLTVAGLINMKNYTVGTLPAGTQGDICYVTDALAPTFLVAVVGGGAVVTPVFRNATVWVSF